MDLGRILFTRQQIGELIGLDDTTLNYWMREEVIRSVEGGGGRGQPRRFTYSEVNLAAIINEVRRYGAGLPALKSLAEGFHSAEDRCRAIGMEPRELRLVWILRDVLRQFQKHGFYPAPAVDVPHLVPDHRGPITQEDKVSLREWAQVKDWLRSAPFYQEQLQAVFEDQHFGWAETLPDDQIDDWLTLMLIHRPPSKRDHDSSSLDLVYFTREENGDWRLSGPKAVSNGSGQFSHIAIEVYRLIYEVWNCPR